jgi:protein TonB
MKKILILVFTLFSFQLIDAQELIAKPQDKIYQMEEVDIKPEYPGGIMEFNKFIAKNFNSPIQEGLNGKIVVAFIIEIDGNVSNVIALQDLGYSTGKDAVDVVKKSKKWIPAQKDGNQVRVVYKTPITIRSVSK